MTNKSLSILALIATMNFSEAAYAREEVINQADAKKACGTVLKGKTRYDGIQSTFRQQDETGKLLAVYHLKGKTPQAVSALETLPQNASATVCVLGVPSKLQMIDSPPWFYIFEISAN